VSGIDALAATRVRAYLAAVPADRDEGWPRADVEELLDERDALTIRIAQLTAMRRADCPQAAPEDTCLCCTFGSHTEACTCDGSTCCHPERHGGSW
jgi:hypothetical protein